MSINRPGWRAQRVAIAGRDFLYYPSRRSYCCLFATDFYSLAMGSWSADLRRLDAAQRRDEREAKRRQKELERRLKEQAKLSALEQARLAVEAHDNDLEVLLSVHKEQSAAVDWPCLASGLP